MFVRNEYLGYHELPSYITKDKTASFNTPLMIEAFERTLTIAAGSLLEEMDTPIVITRQSAPRIAEIICHEGQAMLVISLGQWMQVLDKSPRTGRRLLEGVLVNARVKLHLVRTDRLVLDTGSDNEIVWLGSPYTVRNDPLRFLDQPWEREAHIEEASHLTRIGLFPCIREAWYYLENNRA